MLKKALFVVGSAIAVSTVFALPASAVGGGGFEQAEPVPEPVTVIGSILVGGGMLAKKLSEQQ